MRPLKALILAGGFGTRLRPISCTRPKSLFPILNKPLLQWTFERLAKDNVTEAILAVNYLTEAAIKQHRIPKYGIQTTYSRDPLRKPLGTGGPIKRAEKHLGDDAPFLVLNGDIFADVDHKRLLKMHEKKDAVATIALHRVEDPCRYGVVDLAKDNRIEQFVEKPTRESAPSDLINAGTYALAPEIFEYIPKGRAVSMEREIFPKLAVEGTLYGYVYDGLWIDIGQPKDYLQINITMLAKFATAQTRKNTKWTAINPVAFDKGVSIGRHSVIGPNVVLGRNVSVGEDVRIEDSVILEGTLIADSGLVEGAIIGDGVIIGESVKIGKGCILGDHVRIRDKLTLAPRVSVCPAKEVSENVLTSGNVC